MLGQFFSAQEELALENIGERTIETLKRNPFKITGGVSASTVFMVLMLMILGILLLIS